MADRRDPTTEKIAYSLSHPCPRPKGDELKKYLLFYSNFLPLIIFFQKWGICMAKGAREFVKLKSSESTEVYWTTKNKRNTTERMELKKYDKKLRRHVAFKEAK